MPLAYLNKLPACAAPEAEYSPWFAAMDGIAESHLLTGQACARRIGRVQEESPPVLPDLEHDLMAVLVQMG